MELSDKDKFWRDNSRGPGSFGIKMHLDAFGHILTHFDTFGHIWTCLDAFGQGLDKSGQGLEEFGRCLEEFGEVWRSLKKF